MLLVGRFPRECTPFHPAVCWTQVGMLLTGQVFLQVPSPRHGVSMEMLSIQVTPSFGSPDSISLIIRDFLYTVVFLLLCTDILPLF